MLLTLEKLENMARFAAYFDASGHPDTPKPMFVCGLISSAEKWLKFQEKWLTLLEGYEIESPFHMTDFMAGEKQFKAWADDKRARDEFQLRALKLINRYTLKDVAIGIDVADFDRVHREYVVPPDSPVEQLSKPFPYCAMGAFVETLHWANNYVAKHHKKRPTLAKGFELEYVFDRDDKHRGQFKTVLRRVFRQEPIFRSTREAVPLQAADMIAWYLANAAKEMTAPNHVIRGPRDALIEAARALPGAQEWRYADWGHFEAHCDKHGYAKKTAAG